EGDVLPAHLPVAFGLFPVRAAAAENPAGRLSRRVQPVADRPGVAGVPRLEGGPDTEDAVPAEEPALSGHLFQPPLRPRDVVAGAGGQHDLLFLLIHRT